MVTKRMLVAIPVLLIAAVLVARHGHAVPSAPSVTLNQPNPVPYGSTVTFTEVFPREAQGNGRTPQFPHQPNVQVDCFQGATQVAREGTVTDKTTKQNLGGGWYTAQSGPIILTQSQEFTWPPSAAMCQATMYSVEQQNGQPIFTVWATSSFQVGGP